MAQDLPRYYFRLRPNGATCFHVDADNPRGRIEIDPIAQINFRKGTVTPQGEQTLSEADRAEIAAWIEARAGSAAERAGDAARRAIDELNMTAHWAQSTASDAELEEVTDALLLAMHDLRSVLMRRTSSRPPRQ